ncbi:hypothetical protein [Campylobacter gracilis]|uniref:Uncharacterized protein n=1 Tax=Campylobacter gracilis RM3268 TaxID=553220 RepID=C8PIJ1_9BACT|nr:hypothetical protein [Campylobacter gracilis]AKT92079.1 hypothetical protein CGRAC_0624 [Campylobacter gracilis]EEV17356.1 hypothetical protein CAMGR0001_1652 [Campylobacter gracilis RM3268]UEB45726.1 hypothetical protein LK410_01100 [Campylobacter gracilis]SUW81596.1 Uncharacterised protein [Campylobacter gracilis]
MFWLLNRLRGSYNYFAKVNAIYLAAIIYLSTKNIYASILCGLGYILGESFGWGVWVGALITHSGFKDERENRLIERGAARLFEPKTHWLAYCRLCLFLRGLLWWLPVFVPLVFAGLYGAPLLAVLLAAGFPLACELGYRTHFKFRLKKFEVNTAWARQELFYGAMQDLAFTAIYLISKF